jgi:Divergent InlB B-repeat domain
VRRITILLAALGALLLIPATQAFAGGTANVTIEGHGAGEVSSVGGVGAFESGNPEFTELFESFGPAAEGSPPIQCSYPPQAGTCEAPVTLDEALEVEGVALHAVAAPGSEFAGWTVEEIGAVLGVVLGCSEGNTLVEPGETPTFCMPFREEVNPHDIHVAALFCNEGESLEECEAEEPEGPTNRRTLTLTKSPDAANGEGVGTVSSKPKGIKCTITCQGTAASLYQDGVVLLKAKPNKTSTFEGWGVGDCEAETVSPTEGTCTVTMSEDLEVEAIFGGSSKEIIAPQALTLTKAGDGHGLVKSKPGGVVCEADCTEATASYQGEYEYKPGKFKPAKIVLLTATASLGSEFTGWEGCEAEPEGKCEVSMEAAQNVSAEFIALPDNTLTVTKSPNAANGEGVGTVSSKPKAIKCTITCQETTATLSEDTVVLLKAKPNKTSTFEGWGVGDCDAETVTPTEGTCTVAMSAAREVEAIFGGSSKAITAPQALTLAKAGSGEGLVKSKPGGVVCEAACDEAVALFQGEYEYKPGKFKPAKIVILKAYSAPGSAPVIWSGCEAEPEPEPGFVECEVSMTTAQAVTATFDELE